MSGEEREAIVRWSRVIYGYVAADMVHICWSGRSATAYSHVTIFDITILSIGAWISVQVQTGRWFALNLLRCVLRFCLFVFL